jgi:hypothetical protein
VRSNAAIKKPDRSKQFGFFSFSIQPTPMQRIRAYSHRTDLDRGILLAAVFFFGYLGYGLLRPDVVNEPFSGETRAGQCGQPA